MYTIFYPHNVDGQKMYTIYDQWHVDGQRMCTIFYPHNMNDQRMYVIYDQWRPVERQLYCRSEHEAICNCRLRRFAGVAPVEAVKEDHISIQESISGLQIRICSEPNCKFGSTAAQRRVPAGSVPSSRTKYLSRQGKHIHRKTGRYLNESTIIHNSSFIIKMNALKLILALREPAAGIMSLLSLLTLTGLPTLTGCIAETRCLASLPAGSTKTTASYPQKN
jgi:hypothetical protein